LLREPLDADTGALPTDAHSDGKGASSSSSSSASSSGAPAKVALADAAALKAASDGVNRMLQVGSITLAFRRIFFVVAFLTYSPRHVNPGEPFRVQSRSLSACNYTLILAFAIQTLTLYSFFPFLLRFLPNIIR
jgi:hypothetical protein